MPKRNESHWYPEEGVTDKDGYGFTACGRKGRDVGGLITPFFKMIKTKQRCRVCNKKYNSRTKQNGKAKDENAVSG